MNIGKLIKAYRAKRRIYQSEMAILLDISPAHLSKIESGQHEPKAETTIKAIGLLFPELWCMIKASEDEADSIIEGEKRWLNTFNKNKTYINGYRS